MSFAGELVEVSKCDPGPFPPLLVDVETDGQEEVEVEVSSKPERQLLSQATTNKLLQFPKTGLLPKDSSLG